MSNLIFDPEKHEYWRNGIRLPSVHNVIDAIYGKPYYPEGEAADKGIFIHELCFSYLKNGVIPTTVEDCEGYLDAFLTWVEDNKINIPDPLLIGKPIHFNGYAGTPDLIWNPSPSAITITDIKSGAENEIRDTMQLIGYREGNSKLITTDLYLKPDGTYQEVERKWNSEAKHLWKVFQSQVFVLNHSRRF